MDQGREVLLQRVNGYQKIERNKESEGRRKYGGIFLGEEGGR